MRFTKNLECQQQVMNKDCVDSSIDLKKFVASNVRERLGSELIAFIKPGQDYVIKLDEAKDEDNLGGIITFRGKLEVSWEE